MSLDSQRNLEAVSFSVMASLHRTMKKVIQQTHTVFDSIHRLRPESDKDTICCILRLRTRFPSLSIVPALLFMEPGKRRQERMTLFPEREREGFGQRPLQNLLRRKVLGKCLWPWKSVTLTVTRKFERTLRRKVPSARLTTFHVEGWKSLLQKNNEMPLKDSQPCRRRRSPFCPEYREVPCNEMWPQCFIVPEASGFWDRRGGEASLSRASTELTDFDKWMWVKFYSFLQRVWTTTKKTPLTLFGRKFVKSPSAETDMATNSSFIHS